MRPNYWKLLGVAGVAGVAATGVVVARRRRAPAELEPDEIRERLHQRLAEVRESPRGGGGAVVEDGGRLPDLPALVRGLQRRRHRRPPGHHRPARPPERARRRRDLALARLPLAPGRQRLRHRRLPGHRADVRHAGGLRRAARRGPRARHEARDGPRRQPHLGRARLVQGVAREPRQPEARLVLVARAAQRLALVVLRLGLGASTRPPASTTCTCSRAACPTSTGRTRRSARRSTR